MQASVTMAAKFLASLSWRVPILRFSFSESNIRSMMFRYRCVGRSISRGALVWACASWFAVESQAASGRDHSTDAMLGIVAFVCQQPMAALASPTSFAGDADLIPGCLSIRDVADLTRRQQKT